MIDATLQSVGSHFEIAGTYVGSARLGSGHINATYMAKYRGAGELRFPSTH